MNSKYGNTFLSSEKKILSWPTHPFRHVVIVLRHSSQLFMGIEGDIKSVDWTDEMLGCACSGWFRLRHIVSVRDGHYKLE